MGPTLFLANFDSEVLTMQMEHVQDGGRYLFDSEAIFKPKVGSNFAVLAKSRKLWLKACENSYLQRPSCCLFFFVIQFRHLSSSFPKHCDLPIHRTISIRQISRKNFVMTSMILVCNVLATSFKVLNSKKFMMTSILVEVGNGASYDGCEVGD